MFSTTNSSLLSVIALLGLGLVPAGLAATLTQSVPAAREVTGKPQRDSLVFLQYAVHLGEVQPVGTVPAHFDFFNNSDRPIKITSLDPSCGCLAPQLYDRKELYGPGEHGRFYVSVKTANESPGPKEYTVKVSYNDGQPKERMVAFNLTVPDKKVSVTPSEIYFYQIQGKPDSREIYVEDFRGRDLNVVAVNSQSEFTSVTLGEKVRDGQITRTPIRIDVPGDVPPGRMSSWLTIETDDPDYQVIKVPVLIWGPEQTVQPVKAEEVVNELSEPKVLVTPLGVE